ncbi:hypothetical protein [Echinicola vietnamensis]|uniref:PEGA domain-containing protein n=1 Tax=Echinicola vietnamensis (strain DSM 17526 / LMG 23754 / KMM 6221) TaxID=926556 RepID=L0FTF1_ECHVK|nr:hypothetical protein [Echinicola vietnamensis]AGA76323.1 hypothetical protein Echvi_0019 [Echinicola vietnamensis DSM 17526]
MKKLSTLLTLFVLTASVALAFDKKVKISASEPDANIYVDGQLAGTGSVELKIEKRTCINVRVEKVGFVVEERTLCDQKNQPKPNKREYIKLAVDEAYTASSSSDIANVDISLKPSKDELEAWQLVSRIVTSYFDVIETTDRETGYLRTAWVAQNFNGSVVRSRCIVKLGNTSPLEYKVKLVSEYVNAPGVSVKTDEAFREWDRILRKYEGLIPEMQSRVGR